MSPEHTEKRLKSISSRARRLEKPVVVALSCCLVVLGWLVRTVYMRQTYIESDNAQVQGDFNTLDAQVNGLVMRVLVHEHDPVLQGQVLCVLDDRPFRAALAQAQAGAQAIEARLAAAEKDRTRYDQLWREHAVSRQTRDHANQLARDLSEQVSAAHARVGLAWQALQKTRVLAPNDGRLAFRAAQPGMRVRAGTPLFGFVDARTRWITAKFKETDLQGFKIGDEVRIQLAYGDRELRGRVESIERATEAPFAAVPPDRGAGNFTKYVQWVPVRVGLLLWLEDRERLPIGLTASVRLRRG
jgi:membrane fusion protein (multidrug efflux system)